jgi:hypothetical protein
LTNLLALFANNILPIFLAAGTGFLLSKLLKVTPRSVSQVGFYIFTPCLVYKLLTTSQLSGSEVLRMTLFTIISTIVVGVITWVLARFFNLDRRLLVAVLLAAMFSNAGNYGLSLNLFAFGETAVAHASVYFVVSIVLTYTIGVVLASLGTTGLKEALLGMFKVPALYTAILALISNVLRFKLPLPVERAVFLLGDATIPTLLVLMGIQLASASWDGQYLALGLANSMRLLVAPAVALGIVVLLRLSGAAMQAAISESGAPTAVFMTILATEYEVEPSFVTTAVVTSTLLSPLTMTPLIALLGA